jgi:hypothetical protein
VQASRPSVDMVDMSLPRSPTHAQCRSARPWLTELVVRVVHQRTVVRDELIKQGPLVEVLFTPHPARPHVGLLGRDFLQYVRFEYDGPSGMYQLIDERLRRPDRT